MKNHPAVFALAITVAVLLGACAPASRVILLPPADGRPTAVEVRTSSGAQVLDRPYAVANVRRLGAIEPDTTSAAEVAEDYPRLIALQPPAPVRFVLEFEPGTSLLTAASQGQLGSIIEGAKARKGGEIVVTGHTDRQGSVEANDKLSLERATAIRSLLIERGFKAELIDAVGRGEREPAVATDDEVVEPRNRRAELLVR
jgi:OOP family OmpA-OmpF porin